MECVKTCGSLDEYPDFGTLEEELQAEHPFYAREWFEFMKRANDGSLEETRLELEEDGYLFDEEGMPICNEYGKHMKKQEGGEE